MKKALKTTLIIVGGIVVVVIGVKVAAHYTIPTSYRSQPVLYWLNGSGLGKFEWWKVLSCKLDRTSPNYIFG